MSDPITRLNAALEGRYRIERQLGEGGMATVYLADDLRHERKVALKVLKPELAAVLGADRFLAEIKTTANLQHPHILPLFDSGEADSFLFYVMPYVEGESLRDALARERQLSVEDTLAILTKVAGALDYANARGVIHRDIKPANILLHGGEPVVADFGIALAVNAAGGGRLTETGLSLGTPHYMAPEQATGEGGTDARSDVYSLGAMVYEMLAGEPPHTGSTAQAVLARVLADQPRPLHERRRRVPPWTAAAVDRALAALPADRFKSAGAFAEAATTPKSLRAGSSWGRHGTIAATALLASAMTVAAIWGLGGATRTVSAEPAPPVERPITFTGTASRVSISPDGLTLAYQTPAGLVTKDVRGGRESVLMADWVGGPGAQPHWAGDGSAILFGRQLRDRDWQVVSIPRLGGDPAPVLSASLPGGQPVADFVPFRSDNRVLVLRTLEPEQDKPWLRIYSTPSSNSYVGIDVDPTAVRLWDATVSPDGRWIAYIAERTDGSVFIATAPTEGAGHNVVLEGGQELSKWEEISSNPDWPWFPTIRWAADDRVYYRRHSGRGIDVYVLGIDLETGGLSREPRAVIRGLPRASTFDVSADGSRLSYVGGTVRAHVHLLSLDSTDSRGVALDSTLTQGTGWNVFPRISPDGRRIAFIARTFETADIFIAERGAPGFRRLNVALEWRTIWDMLWSHDGTKLLAHVQPPGGGYRLLEIDVANGQFEDHGELENVPVQLGWSPDGRYILYGTADAGAYVVRELETDHTTTLFEEIGGELIWGMFSPDGRYVLAQDIATNLLWIAPIDGGPSRSIGPIYQGSMDNTTPRAIQWGADGLIRILDPGARTLATISPDGGEPQVVAHLPISCIHEGGSSLTADASVLLCSGVERESDVWVVEDFDQP